MGRPAVGHTAPMKWYADDRGLRTRQQLLDAVMLLCAALLLRLGRFVYTEVDRLRAAGAELQQAGGGLAGGLSDAGRRVGGAPLVGRQLRGPLDTAAAAARAVASAAQQGQLAIHRVALVLGFAMALLPLAYVVSRWLPDRLRYAREAGAAVRLRGDVELLALRAATTSPLRLLARLGPEPVGRWRRGEPGAAQALADLELGRLGLLTTPGGGLGTDRRAGVLSRPQPAGTATARRQAVDR